MSTTSARASLPVRNPRTGEIDLHITPASAPEIAAVCQRLKAAQPAWGDAPIEHRVAVMRRWVERLKAHRAALVEADSTDTGGGQISQVAPDMVMGSILRLAAHAPAQFRELKRAGFDVSL